MNLFDQVSNDIKSAMLANCLLYTSDAADE